MRTINTHPDRAIRFTPYAAMICRVLNNYKKANPTSTFAEMTRWYNRAFAITPLSVTSVRRYYYGLHGYNNGMSYSQVRRGARVSI